LFAPALGCALSKVASVPARRSEFLKKAKEAEELADKTSDAAAKKVWLRIAASYRDLAQLVPTQRRIF
jgi:hypothetical protein